MSSFFTYSPFSSLFIFVIIILIYNYFKYGKIKKILVNPINVIVSFLFLAALWLVDVTTLSMSIEGANTTVGLVPGLHSQTPALFTYLIMLLGMWLVVFYFFFINKKIPHNEYKVYNLFAILTEFLGLLILSIFSILLILLGHDSTIFLFNTTFYNLGMYHSSLPLLILFILIISLDID